MKVVASGRITVFPRDGAYQLYCDSLIPEGVGDLAVAFEQLKEKLWQEGLFDPAHKKPLPPYPERIAIVTSAAGAAVHDMLRILRPPVSHCQGDAAAGAGPGGRGPAGDRRGHPVRRTAGRSGDVIITGRGGGSMEDLWAFNDERVARAIYDCETPVISAVGHEPDVTIADFVADARASTPSNAAEIAVPDQVELLRWLRGAGERMARSETARLETARQRLDRPGGQAGDDGPEWPTCRTSGWTWTTYSSGWGTLTGAVLGRHAAEIRGPGGVAGRHEPAGGAGPGLRRGPG